ncbi:hypothetical protein JCM16138_16100 [Thermococcus atlanticus]
MKRVTKYWDHEIFEDEEFWIIKGPIINDMLPWEFFPDLTDVLSFIDDILSGECGE